jgi:uncharacterized protein YktB (UPF0637 family)
MPKITITIEIDGDDVKVSTAQKTTNTKKLQSKVGRAYTPEELRQQKAKQQIKEYDPVMSALEKVV